MSRDVSRFGPDDVKLASFSTVSFVDDRTATFF